MPTGSSGCRKVAMGCLAVPVLLIVIAMAAALFIRLTGPSHGYPKDCGYRIAGCTGSCLGVVPLGDIHTWTSYPFNNLPRNRRRHWGGPPWDVCPSNGTICYTAVPPKGDGSCVEVASICGPVLYRSPEFAAFSLAFNKSGDKVGMIGSRGEVYPYRLYVWDLKTGAFDCVAMDLAEYGFPTLTVFSWLDDRTVVATLPKRSIESIDVVTKKRTVIAAMGVTPSVSPDGRCLAYTKVANEEDWEGARPVLKDLATGAETNLGSDILGYNEMVWTPDSAFIAYGDTSGLLRWPCIALKRIRDGKVYIIHDYAWQWDQGGVANMGFVSDATLTALAQGGVYVDAVGLDSSGARDAKEAPAP